MFGVTGDAYDRFMGRYSRPLAASLLGWLDVSPGQRALDVGCGPGALTALLADRLGVDHIAAVDPSPQFVQACRSRLPGIDVREGTSASLPFDDDDFDVATANLVVHFMPDPVAGISEMARVVRDGGWVCATTWDLAGSRAPMAVLWSALHEMDPGYAGEGAMPGATRGELRQFFERAGLRDVEDTEIEVRVTHPTFDEWWTPHLNKIGPIGETIAALDDRARDQLQAACRKRLGDGPFEISAASYAARGRA